jgi:multidrug efflux pump subunit AcrA (membrane-fusion protein)
VSTDAATLRLILPSADPLTRRIPVEIGVPNEDGRFAAHTLVRASLTLGDPKPAQAIPATALVSAGGDHVFTVGAHDAVQRQAVRVIERGSKEAVVKADTPLTQVIDDPAAELTEGTQVTTR